MKKIRMKHKDKDRIICVTGAGKHEFYYQPQGSKERLWLFATKKFSGSVFTFFRKNGRNFNFDGIGYSMTLAEIYRIKTRNSKINKVMERIPGQVEYVLSERGRQKQETEETPNMEAFKICDGFGIGYVA